VPVLGVLAIALPAMAIFLWWHRGQFIGADRVNQLAGDR
jgi:hypothetical protein